MLGPSFWCKLNNSCLSFKIWFCRVNLLFYLFWNHSKTMFMLNLVWHPFVSSTIPSHGLGARIVPYHQQWLVFQSMPPLGEPIDARFWPLCFFLWIFLGLESLRLLRNHPFWIPLWTVAFSALLKLQTNFGSLDFVMVTWFAIFYMSF